MAGFIELGEVEPPDPFVGQGSGEAGEYPGGGGGWVEDGEEGLAAVIGYAGMRGECYDAEEDWSGRAPSRSDVECCVSEPATAVCLGRGAVKRLGGAAV